MNKEKFMQIYFEEIRSSLYQTYCKESGTEVPNEKLQDIFNILYFSDNYTKVHSENVSYYASMLAESIGLDPEEVERIRIGALLHDIGKILIPNPILTKAGYLTDVEYEIIKRHPIIGEQLLLCNNEEIYKDIVRHHHERFDGRGYPDRLSKNEIPLAARITSISDTFDAMINHRPYGRLLTVEQAVEELQKSSGSQLDKELVDQFINLMTYTTPNKSLILRRKK